MAKTKVTKTVAEPEIEQAIIEQEVELVEEVAPVEEAVSAEEVNTEAVESIEESPAEEEPKEELKEEPAIEILEEKEVIKEEAQEEKMSPVSMPSHLNNHLKKQGVVILIAKDGCYVQDRKGINHRLYGKAYTELKIGDTVEF